jgi:hypothetical protein
MAGAALDRFGTDRLGAGTLETDRLLAVDHRARSPEIRVQAALRADVGRVLANWVLRIANLPVYRARPDLALDQLMDGLPRLVHAVLHAIATPDPALDPDPATHAAETAAEHARRRAAAGFPAGAVLAELRELHVELLAQLWRIVDETLVATSADAPATSPTDAAWMPRSTIERLAMTIGDLSAAAAEANAAPTTASVDAGEPATTDRSAAKGRRR